jgi:hypothetical protein
MSSKGQDLVSDFTCGDMYEQVAWLDASQYGVLAFENNHIENKTAHELLTASDNRRSSHH